MPPPQQNQSSDTAQQVKEATPVEPTANPNQPVELRKALQILSRGAPNLNTLESDEARVNRIVEDMPHGPSRETLANFAKSQSASAVLQAIKGELLYEAGGVLTYKWKMNYQSTTSQFVQNAMNRLITSGVIDEQRFVKQDESVTLDQALGSLYHRKLAESSQEIRQATDRFRQDEIKKQEMIRETYSQTAGYFNPQYVDQAKVDSIQVEGPSKIGDVTNYNRAEMQWVARHAQKGVKEAAQVAAVKSGLNYQPSPVTSESSRSAVAMGRVNAPTGAASKTAIDPLSPKATLVDQARALYNKELAKTPKETKQLARELVANNNPNQVEALKGTLSHALNKTNDAKQKSAIEASLKALEIAQVEKKIAEGVRQKGDIMNLAGDLDRLGGEKAVASFLYRQQAAGNAELVAEVMECSRSNPNDQHKRLLHLLEQAASGPGNKLNNSQLAVVEHIRNLSVV